MVSIYGPLSKVVKLRIRERNCCNDINFTLQFNSIFLDLNNESEIICKKKFLLSAFVHEPDC